MTERFDSLVRLAATIVVVANAATAALHAVADTGESSVLVAVGLASIGPLLVAIAAVTRTALVLPAFVSALIGLGAALGVVGWSGLAGPIVLLALLVAAVTCVAATLVQAQASLQEPRNRF